MESLYFSNVCSDFEPAFKIYAWVRCQRVLMNGVQFERTCPIELDSNQSCRNSLCLNDFLPVGLSLSESSRIKCWTKMIKHTKLFWNSVTPLKQGKIEDDCYQALPPLRTYGVTVNYTAMFPMTWQTCLKDLVPVIWMSQNLVCQVRLQFNH